MSEIVTTWHSVRNKTPAEDETILLRINMKEMKLYEELMAIYGVIDWKDSKSSLICYGEMTLYQDFDFYATPNTGEYSWWGVNASHGKNWTDWEVALPLNEETPLLSGVRAQVTHWAEIPIGFED